MRCAHIKGSFIEEKLQKYMHQAESTSVRNQIETFANNLLLLLLLFIAKNRSYFIFQLKLLKTQIYVET